MPASSVAVRSHNLSQGVHAPDFSRGFVAPCESEAGGAFTGGSGFGASSFFAVEGPGDGLVSDEGAGAALPEGGVAVPLLSYEALAFVSDD